MTDPIRELLGVVCAQDPARAYAPGGEALRVCARCLGVHLGLLAGIAWWVVARPMGRPSAAVLYGVLGACALMGVLGFGAVYGVVDLPTDARAATGGVFGAAVIAGLTMRFGRAEVTWPARVTRSLLGLVVVAAALPLVVGRIEVPGLAGAMAVVGVVAGLAMANAVMFAGWVRRNDDGRPCGSPVQAMFVRVPLCVLLVAVELATLTAWRAAWRA